MSENEFKRDYPKETLCPSCGKFIGSWVRCPYCGTKAARRTSIRFFRIFSIAMSLGGVFIIWLVARGVDAPLIEVANIGPTYNFGIVRVEGAVNRARISDWGSLDFEVDDGTGKIRVRAYKGMAERIVAARRFPSDGDKVSVEGTLRLGGASPLPLMVVNIPEKIRILSSPPPASLSSISSLSKDQLGERVRLDGKITGVRDFGKGTAITLGDGTGSLEIVIWNSDKKRLGAKEKLLEEGRYLSIQGALGEYRDKLQIVLKAARDIEEMQNIPEKLRALSLSAPAAETGPSSISSLSREQLGNKVRLEGEITEIRKFSKGTGITLDDGTGTLEFIVWNGDRSSLGEKEKLLEKGRRVSIQGKLSEYRDKLQVILKSKENIRGI